MWPSPRGSTEMQRGGEEALPSWVQRPEPPPHQQGGRWPPHGRDTPPAACPPWRDTGPRCSFPQGALMKNSWNKLGKKKAPSFILRYPWCSIPHSSIYLASLSTAFFHCIWNLSLAKRRREKRFEITSFENYATNAAVVMNNVCWHSLNILQIIYRSQQNAYGVPGAGTELVCFVLVKPFSWNKIQGLRTSRTFQMTFPLSGQEAVTN